MIIRKTKDSPRGFSPYVNRFRTKNPVVVQRVAYFGKNAGQSIGIKVLSIFLFRSGLNFVTTQIKLK
jgi:hypothetical protein